MNEPRRLTYLQAMGIDSYVSRAQLPGAAATRRLAVVQAVQAESDPAVPVQPDAPGREALLRSPRADVPVVERPERKSVNEAVAPVDKPQRPAMVRFNLAAVFAGGVAWLESLEGRPLATEQVKLIHAMARAVHGEVAAPKVAQFDWPLHSNHQLNQDIGAARAAVGAFLQRHVDEQHCRAVVILGQQGAEFVDVGQLGGMACVVTLSTAEMLQNPSCKRRVWSDLQALVLRV